MEEQNKKVLVVEDDDSTRKILKTKLSEEGFSVETAENGVECLEKVSKVLPDIIVLDLIMPLMGGQETIDNLKKTDKTKDIPVILLTNINSEDDIANAMEKGVQDYLVKTDHTIEDVVSCVKNKLQ